MATIYAYGLSLGTSVPLAKARMDMKANGLSLATSVCLGNLINPVTILSVIAYSISKIRITFDRAMKKNSALLDVSSYVIENSSTNSAKIYYSEVECEKIGSPRYVDVILDSEMTNGGSYDVDIETTDGPISENNIPLIPETNSDSFTGLGILPVVLYVQAITKNIVDVVFSEAMTDNSSIRDKTNYSFDNGLSVLSIIEMEVNKVRLRTSDQVPGTLYTLTIS